MVKRSESWHTRSPLSRFAHVVERTGLALTGGSCGLFVAAYIARSDFNLIGSGGTILAGLWCGWFLSRHRPAASSGEAERAAIA